MFDLQLPSIRDLPEGYMREPGRDDHLVIRMTPGITLPMSLPGLVPVPGYPKPSYPA
jgi:hypothetical protein